MWVSLRVDPASTEYNRSTVVRQNAARTTAGTWILRDNVQIRCGGYVTIELLAERSKITGIITDSVIEHDSGRQPIDEKSADSVTHDWPTMCGKCLPYDPRRQCEKHNYSTCHQVESA